MTLTPGCQQRPVHRIRLVVNQQFASQCRERPAGFVQQKIGRGKIPVVTVRRGKRAIERSAGHPRETQRKRRHARAPLDARLHRGKAVQALLCAGEPCTGDAVTDARMDRCIVEGRPLSGDGQEQLVRYRSIECGNYRPAFTHQRGRDRPVG